jgi:hypothetical protein
LGPTHNPVISRSRAVTCTIGVYRLCAVMDLPTVYRRGSG